ncbi:hypothetical protein ACOME3_009187 [Neoechinorhynchus agilis]
MRHCLIERLSLRKFELPNDCVDILRKIIKLKIDNVHSFESISQPLCELIRHLPVLTPNAALPTIERIQRFGWIDRHQFELLWCELLRLYSDEMHFVRSDNKVLIIRSMVTAISYASLWPRPGDVFLSSLSKTSTVESDYDLRSCLQTLIELLMDVDEKRILFLQEICKVHYRVDVADLVVDEVDPHQMSLNLMPHLLCDDSRDGCIESIAMLLNEFKQAHHCEMAQIMLEFRLISQKLTIPERIGKYINELLKQGINSVRSAFLLVELSHTCRDGGQWLFGCLEFIQPTQLKLSDNHLAVLLSISCADPEIRSSFPLLLTENSSSSSVIVKAVLSQAVSTLIRQCKEKDKMINWLKEFTDNIALQSVIELEVFES